MRGIVIGGVVLGLLMGCNNGIADELAAQKRLGEIGRSAEKAFYSFMDFIADTLGFIVTAKTTKKEVGEYFSKLGGKVGEASVELEKVAEKSAADGGDKEGILSKAIKEAVDAAKITLNKLKGHLEALKDIGDSSKVGEVGSSTQNGVAADTETLKSVYKALKGIVETAEEAGVEKLKESNVTLVNTSIGGATPQDGAKVLAASANAGADVGGKAAAIVAAVSGKEMLYSIVKSGDKAEALSGQAKAETTPLEFAVGGQASYVADAAAKPAAVAGGIALRSLVKKGKLASHSSNTNHEKVTVESVGMDSANKLLVAVEDIIKKTVKNVLNKVKQEVDKARHSKATDQ